jgi:hypothetical protein
MKHAINGRSRLVNKIKNMHSEAGAGVQDMRWHKAHPNNMYESLYVVVVQMYETMMLI